MHKAIFKIKKMDCPSEEQLIRMKLANIAAIIQLSFDIQQRELTVFHQGEVDEISRSIDELNLGSVLISNEETFDATIKEEDENNHRKILWIVLIINSGFFIIELTTGIISGSMGLVADSLDMLADALIYGLSLFAVGGSLLRKKKIAKLSGYLQIILAMTGLLEVLRRFLVLDHPPEFITMIIVSFFALIGNSISLIVLQKIKSQEVHIRASKIFTSNDIIINLGVICAALLVHYLDSNRPDLIIGIIVFLIVVQGALRILRAAK